MHVGRGQRKFMQFDITEHLELDPLACATLP